MSLELFSALPSLNVKSNLTTLASMSHSWIFVTPRNPLHYFLVLIEKERWGGSSWSIGGRRLTAHALQPRDVENFPTFHDVYQQVHRSEAMKASTQRQVPITSPEWHAGKKISRPTFPRITYLMLFVHFIHLSISLHVRHENRIFMFPSETSAVFFPLPFRVRLALNLCKLIKLKCWWWKCSPFALLTRGWSSFWSCYVVSSVM